MRPTWRALLLGLLLAVGCGGNPPPPEKAPPEKAPPPTRLIIFLSGAADLNPNPLGRPSPAQVRLYELKTATAFSGADFFTLYEQGKTALGAELLAQDERLVKPGERYLLERELQPDARYLGVLAAYSDIDKAQWRAVLAIPPNMTSTVYITAQQRRLLAEMQ